MATAAEATAMRRAIALSAAGIPSTSPNPPVGCVVLAQDGSAAGEGYHVRKGGPHAEAHALAAAGRLARGGTAVVSLEPCNHAGRTPACRQALIDAGIARVVIAVLDPTSRGEGGAARLRQAGLDVEAGVLAAEARVVLGPWLDSLERQRPATTWAYVIGPAGIDAASEAMDDVRALTLGCDAVLHPDGSVREAQPGSHGAGTLTLTGLPPAPDPRDLTRMLYQGGVRRLLLLAHPAAAEPFTAAGLIDRVYAYLPDRDPSRSPGNGEQTAVTPPRFTITGVKRLEGYVRIEAVPMPEICS
jgi:diaminohydroxyphosphoribosylaminopyrimidine deaminase/5-amino-6-(5-phosphoribosylamino)uracil reductase